MNDVTVEGRPKIPSSVMLETVVNIQLSSSIVVVITTICCDMLNVVQTHDASTIIKDTIYKYYSRKQQVKQHPMVYVNQ